MSSPAEIRVPQAGRYALPEPARGRLGRQQRAWGVGQALALTGALLLPVGQQWADLSWALALGVGVAGALLPDAGGPRARPRRSSPGCSSRAWPPTAPRHRSSSPRSSRPASPPAASPASRCWPGRAGGGASRGWTAAPPGPRVVRWPSPGRDRRAGVVGRPGARPHQLGAVPQALGQAGTAALIMSQVPLFSTLRYRSSDRIPAPHRLKARLQAAYRAPCLQAWRLDRELAREAPDPDTRDGLGEVAAWVYRLQVTLQRLDAEIEAIDARPWPPASPTSSTRRGPGGPLHRGAQGRHRGAPPAAAAPRRLAEGQGRTAALVDYAGAFLEGGPGWPWPAAAGRARARSAPGRADPTPHPRRGAEAGGAARGGAAAV